MVFPGYFPTCPSLPCLMTPRWPVWLAASCPAGPAGSLLVSPTIIPEVALGEEVIRHDLASPGGDGPLMVLMDADIWLMVFEWILPLVMMVMMVMMAMMVMIVKKWSLMVMMDMDINDGYFSSDINDGYWLSSDDINHIWWLWWKIIFLIDDLWIIYG